MTDTLQISWQMLLFPLAALCYFELLRRLDRYWANRTPLSDEEILWNHARREGISEYDVFLRAAEKWSLPMDRAEHDFNIYLQKAELPHYLRDYLRQLRTKG